MTIERLAFDMTDLGDQLAVQVSGTRDVVLRDIVTAGTSLLDREPAGGRVFIEDVCCGALRIAGPQPVMRANSIPKAAAPASSTTAVRWWYSG